MSAVAATRETIAKGLQQIGLDYGDTVLVRLQCLRISMVVQLATYGIIRFKHEEKSQTVCE
jgi:hypothetical protein